MSLAFFKCSANIVSFEKRKSNLERILVQKNLSDTNNLLLNTELFFINLLSISRFYKLSFEVFRPPIILASLQVLPQKLNANCMSEV